MCIVCIYKIHMYVRCAISIIAVAYFSVYFTKFHRMVLSILNCQLYRKLFSSLSCQLSSIIDNLSFSVYSFLFSL